jgi:hypothetical protein
MTGGDGMILALACDDPDVLRAIQIGMIILDVVRCLIPILVIIMGIKDFFAVVVGNKDDRMGTAVKMFFSRLLAAILIFYIPTIIDYTFSLIGDDTLAYKACLDKANPEGIRQTKYDHAQVLINKAKESLDFADFATARDYIAKLENTAQKRELEKKLKDVEDYMALFAEISSAKRKEEVPGLKEKINKVTDGNVRKRMLDELDAKFANTDVEDTNIETVANVSIDGSLIKHAETDTLRIWIYKNNTYYVSKIWVNNPYGQLNKFDSPQYGYQLYQPSDLL